jgi:hypothetical protein
MNTMNLFHMAAADNPNHMQQRGNGQKQQLSAAVTAAAPPPLGGGDGFFDPFRNEVPQQAARAVVKNRPLPPGPDAFDDFMDNFHFEREFEFSRIDESRRSDESQQLREDKTEFGTFSMPKDFDAFADVAPPDWLKNSGW